MIFKNVNILYKNLDLGFSRPVRGSSSTDTAFLCGNNWLELNSSQERVWYQSFCPGSWPRESTTFCNEVLVLRDSLIQLKKREKGSSLRHLCPSPSFIQRACSPGGVDWIWVSQLTSPCLKFLHFLLCSLQGLTGLGNVRLLLLSRLHYKNKTKPTLK